MSKYDYPPSQYIMPYGPFDPNSHFFVTGKGHFPEGEYDCEFEVAYTLTGEIIVACYLSGEEWLKVAANLDNTTNVRWQRYAPRGTAIVSDKFVGKETRSGWQIEVRNCIELKYGGLNGPIIFVAETYEVTITDNGSVYNSTIEQPQYELFGLDNHRIILHRDLASNHIVMQVGSNSNIHHDNLDNTLTIHESIVPITWHSRDVANLCCALISLSIGKDVRWTNEVIRNNDTLIETFIRQRNMNVIQSTYAFIPRSTLHLSQADKIIGFIEHVLGYVNSSGMPVAPVREYIKAIHHFVEYCLITNRTEDQSRLITTTVEELLGHWGTFNTPGGKTFRQRLEYFFQNTSIDRSWYNTHVDPRLQNFIKTRNSIVHEGNFPGNTREEWLEHYYNMLMILPLMIFEIFQYRGDYVDLTVQHQKAQAELAKRKQMYKTDD